MSIPLSSTTYRLVDRGNIKLASKHIHDNKTWSIYVNSDLTCERYNIILLSSALIYEPAISITMHVKLRKHFFNIFQKF